MKASSCRPSPCSYALLGLSSCALGCRTQLSRKSRYREFFALVSSSGYIRRLVHIVGGYWEPVIHALSSTHTGLTLYSSVCHIHRRLSSEMLHLLLITMKSWSFVILNDFISGVAITTFGFPPYRGSFASTSPNVRHTDNLPGRTR